jgi:hypothetical protein
MDSKIVSRSNGRSGGVLLLWRKEIKVEQIFAAPNYIDVKIMENPQKIWRLTWVYGEPRWEDRHLTWDKLRELKLVSNIPWVVLGDLNEIAFSHEKEGGNQRPNVYMQAFRDCLDDCELVDVGFSGEPFTWRRGRIRERLDRAVATSEWMIMHPGAILQHLPWTKSDHRPILLDTDYQQVEVRAHDGPKRFEAKWLKEEKFREEVVRAWEQAGAVAGDSVLARLGRMPSSLHAWDKRILKKPKRRLRKAQRELQKALDGPMSDENDEIAKEKANLIELLLEQDEIYWAQRSRANWLQFGDRNSSFFHSFASARRKKNYIKKLKIDNDVWVEGTENLKPLISDYFTNLFTSEVQATDPALLQKIQPKVD